MAKQRTRATNARYSNTEPLRAISEAERSGERQSGVRTPPLRGSTPPLRSMLPAATIISRFTKWKSKV